MAVRFVPHIVPRNGFCCQESWSERNTTGAFVFETERGGRFTADAVNRLVKTIGARAKLSFGVHAHMLRHACGYALANAGHDTRLIQDWLGHLKR